MRNLKVGESYAVLFGYDREKGKDLIYAGGDSFRIINREKGVDFIKESEATRVKIESLINRPYVRAGSPA